MAYIDDRGRKRDGSLDPIGASNCAVREFTADGVSVGRCWHHVKDGKCPRHGDVRLIQEHYIRTGKLTDEGHSKGRRVSG